MNPKILDMPHRVFDIETLGTHGTSIVLECSIVSFVPSTAPTFEQLVEEALVFPLAIDEQVAAARDLTASTLLFWAQQAGETRSLVFKRACETKESIADSFQRMHEAFPEKALWWARGPHFDAAIMDSLARDVGALTPWGYDKYGFSTIRDTRTLLEASGMDAGFRAIKAELTDAGIMIPHDSAHDCALDAYAVSNALLRLAGEPYVEGFQV